MLFGVFGNLTELTEYVILHSENFLIISRIISAFFGLGSIYLAYKFAKDVYNKNVGYLSAILLSLVPLHLLLSQSGQFWGPLTFLILLSFYLLYKLFKTNVNKYYWLSSLAIAFGFGMGYVAIIVVLWFLIIHYFLFKNKKRKLFDKTFILSSLLLVIIIVLFAISNPYALFRQFGKGVGAIFNIFGASFDIPQIATQHQQNNFVFVMFKNIPEVIWYNLYFITIFVIYGIIDLFKKKDLWKNVSNYIIVAFPLFYLLISAIVYTKTPDRYLFPAFPFLIIIAAYGINKLFEKIKISKALKYALVIIIVLPQVYFTLCYSSKLFKDSTFIEAKNWVESNLEVNTRIILDNTYPFYLTPSYQSLKLLEENNSQVLDTKLNYLLNNNQPGYFIYNFEKLDLSKLNDVNAEYYIVAYYNESPLNEIINQNKNGLLDKYDMEKLIVFDSRKDKYIDKHITKVFDDSVNNLITLFYQERLGPTIEIYRLNKKYE